MLKLPNHRLKFKFNCKISFHTPKLTTNSYESQCRNPHQPNPANHIPAPKNFRHHHQNALHSISPNPNSPTPFLSISSRPSEPNIHHVSLLAGRSNPLHVDHTTRLGQTLDRQDRWKGAPKRNPPTESSKAKGSCEEGKRRTERLV